MKLALTDEHGTVIASWDICHNPPERVSETAWDISRPVARAAIMEEIVEVAAHEQARFPHEPR